METFHDTVLKGRTRARCQSYSDLHVNVSTLRQSWPLLSRSLSDTIFPFTPFIISIQRMSLLIWMSAVTAYKYIRCVRRECDIQLELFWKILLCRAPSSCALCARLLPLFLDCLGSILCHLPQPTRSSSTYREKSSQVDTGDHGYGGLWKMTSTRRPTTVLTPVRLHSFTRYRIGPLF